MSTDRELLEMAAKAAGIAYDPDDKSELGLWLVIDTEPSEHTKRRWNPLSNAMDAMNLACTLYMTVKISDGMYTLVDAEIWQLGVFIDAIVELHKDTTPLLATCRAIVRAAAEIGKAMHEPKPV